MKNRIIQMKRMTSHERETFLRAFNMELKTSLVLGIPSGKGIEPVCITNDEVVFKKMIKKGGIEKETIDGMNYEWIGNKSLKESL